MNAEELKINHWYCWGHKNRRLAKFKEVVNYEGKTYYSFFEPESGLEYFLDPEDVTEYKK